MLGWVGGGGRGEGVRTYGYVVHCTGLVFMDRIHITNFLKMFINTMNDSTSP